MSDPSMPSGWFPDPLGRHEHRYFNGTSWTSDVSDGGVRHVDPLGAAPAFGPASESTSNSAATASVVLSSIAMVIAWIPFVVVIGAILVVLAIVFGVKGLRRSRTIGRGRGAAIAGLVMSSIGVVAVVVGSILTVSVWRTVVDFIEPGPAEATIVSCEIDGRRLDVRGEIVNRDDVVHDYTVFVSVGDVTEFAIVEDVAPGATAPWDAVVSTRSILDTCEPEIMLHGPFPFGIEVDPVG